MVQSAAATAVRGMSRGAALGRGPRVGMGQTVKAVRRFNDSAAPDALGETDTEFILSILRSSPSKRDSRAYMASFAPPTSTTSSLPDSSLASATSSNSPALHTGDSNVLVSSLLNPILRRPALVKIQGPFSDLQLQSIAKGMAHLQKLGLVSVIVVDRDDLPTTQPDDGVAAQRQRQMVLRDVERVVAALGRFKAAARPVLATVARAAGLSDTLPDDQGDRAGVNRKEGDVFVEEEGLDHIRRAVAEGEIPVLLPVALDPECRSRRVGADKVLAALAEGMASSPTSPSPSTSGIAAGLDITPLRLLVINREGGIPSYARSGLPHLSINIASEYAFISDTFLPQWRSTHPTALANLTLARNCLQHMPPESSALIVSHRSPAAMIANLITNKPAHSASLPHALLAASEGRITRDTPTLLRKGLPVKVFREMGEVDRDRMTALLEKSFRRKLNQEAFYGRLERDLDFVIVIGDYAGAAIVTRETPCLDDSMAYDGNSSSNRDEHICYLDKFAVDPSHQGDGTVDFLWVALRDETYGLGLLDAANPSEGSLAGRGRGRDLVWRSRSDNPVNKWYYERSSGFTTSQDGKWKMFWCDAEQRLREKAREEGREFGGGRLVRVVEDEERGRLGRWGPAIESIKSAWSD